MADLRVLVANTIAVGTDTCPICKNVFPYSELDELLDVCDECRKLQLEIMLITHQAGRMLSSRELHAELHRRGIFKTSH